MMATVQNKSTGQIDVSYVAPNRKVSALPMPLYAGEIVINTTDGQTYVATPPTSQGGLAATDWVKYSYGMGLN
jgi:hypothetical protein